MEIKAGNFYKVLAPRPTVIITTIDKNGNVNAAPFSFVMPVSMNPALVAFASGHGKHTLGNVRETKEFVVNIPPEKILKKLLITAENFPKGVNELEKAGLTEKKSKLVKPPCIEECIAWFECELEFEKTAGDHVIVVGRVVNAEIADGFMKENGNLDVKKAKPLLHLGGNEFAVPERIIESK